MSTIYTTKETIKSLLGKKVINQYGTYGVISEVDDGPFVLYPIKVIFESGELSKTYTKYGYSDMDSEDFYIELTSRDKIVNDLFRVMDENGSDAEELIAILLDDFANDCNEL